MFEYLCVTSVSKIKMILLVFVKMAKVFSVCSSCRSVGREAVQKSTQIFWSALGDRSGQFALPDAVQLRLAAQEFDMNLVEVGLPQGRVDLLKNFRSKKGELLDDHGVFGSQDQGVFAMSQRAQQFGHVRADHSRPCLPESDQTQLNRSAVAAQVIGKGVLNPFHMIESTVSGDGWQGDLLLDGAGGMAYQVNVYIRIY